MEPLSNSRTPSKVDSQRGIFQAGLQHWHNDELERALACFRSADQHADRCDTYRNLYTSYHGVALVFKGDVSGLNFCRQAAALEHRHADIFCNLALAEHRLKHRRRACLALEQGLKLNPRHACLHRLRVQMGARRPQVLRFLSRDNLLNRLLGRFTYQLTKRKKPLQCPPPRA
jgi:hypothetical protein